MQQLVKDLNRLYRNEPALYSSQFDPSGFEWVEANDDANSVFVYLRKGRKDEEVLMIVLNLTPNVLDYKIGVNEGTSWATVLNTDDQKYGGSGAPALAADVKLLLINGLPEFGAKHIVLAATGLGVLLTVVVPADAGATRPELERPSR